MIVPASHLVLLAALTFGVGAVMVRLGLDRGLLRLRTGERRCPSCGRLIRRRVCPLCADQMRRRLHPARVRKAVE